MKRFFATSLLVSLLCLSLPCSVNALEFTMDGKNYALPLPLPELTEAGWTVPQPQEQLSPGSYTLQDRLSRADETLEVQIINLSRDELSKAQCDVGQVTFTRNFSGKVTLPGNLSLTDSRDTVYAALGTPTDLTTMPDGTELAVYEGDAFDKVAFAFDEQAMTSVTLRSFTPPSGYETPSDDEAAVCQIPEWLSSLSQWVTQHIAADEP